MRSKAIINILSKLLFKNLGIYAHPFFTGTSIRERVEQVEEALFVTNPIIEAHFGTITSTSKNTRLIPWHILQ